MKKILAIILAVIVISSGIGYFIWESQSYVAKVGNQKIKNHEYTFFLRAQKITTETEAGATDVQEVEQLWETPVEGEDPKIIIMNQALENAKEFKVQLIKAEQEKFKLSDKEKKEILAYLDTSLQNNDNVNYVKNDLGLTLPQFRDMMLKSELVSRYAYDFMQKNRETLSVTDEEAKAHYEQNKDAIDEVTVSHLLIATNQEGLTEAQKLDKKKLADDLLKRIGQGEDIASLVREHSDDAISQDSGGIYTFTYVQMADQQYSQVFGDWAFNVDIGELEMIESEYGYHIVKLEGIKTYEDKKELVKSAIKAQKLNEYYYNQVQLWNKDPAFNLIKNDKVLNEINRRSFSKN